MDFVRIKNSSEEVVKFRPHFQRPTKSAPPVYDTLTLKPGTTSREILPRNAVVGCRQWAAIKDLVTLVPFKAFTGFVALRAKVQQVRAKVKVHIAGRRVRAKELILRHDKPTTIHLPSVENRQLLRELQRKRKITMEPISYIAPYYRHGSAGSYGSEDVYICWDCGGPIVFRGSPPTPIHI